MNSYDYVTALQVRQHQDDLLRQAQEHRLAVAARQCPPESTAPRRTARWWRRGAAPHSRREIAGA